MATREEIEAYLDAPDEPSGGAVDAERLAAIEAFLDAPDEGEPAPDVSIPETVYRGAVQGGTFRFGDEIKGTIGAGYYAAAKGVRALLPGGVPGDAPDVVDVYRAIRDQEQQANAAAQAANPGTYLASEIGGGLAVTGTNPVSVVRSAGGAVLGGGRALLAGTPGAARSLLSLESAAGAVAGAKAAGTGAGYAALASAGGSEADLTRGEFGEFASGLVDDTLTGAGVGFLTRGLLSARSANVTQRAQAATANAATAARVAKFDDEVATLPERSAAVKTQNAAAREAADAENLAAREQFRKDSAAAKAEAQAESKRRGKAFGEEVAAAKAEAQAATVANRQAAEAAAAEATRKNPLVRTGLEGKQKSLGGGKRAKARAQALVNEPLPGDPSRRLIDEAEKLTPDERLDLATGLRRETGAQLGAVRDELAKVEGVLVPVAPLRAELRLVFGDLPSTVQAKALEQLDALIGSVAKDGALNPAALRKLIEDAEGFANFSTPNLEAALGDARGRVFQAARAALVRNERQLIETALPNRAPEYTEALRKYGVYSDFELGSKVMLERANKGQALVKAIKPEKVDKVAPRQVPRPEPAIAREVPRPELRQPMLKPEPPAPEFPGGPEALAAGRKLLEPSLGARVVAGGMRLAAGDAAARAGALLPVPGSAVAAQRLASAGTEVVAERWLRWMTPTAGKLSAKAAKLERLAPRFERAIQGGSAAVARLHAQLLAESPDYRAAIAEEDEEE